MKNKKEKILTVREENDYNNIFEELDNFFNNYTFTYVEILGFLEVYKTIILKEMECVGAQNE